MPTTFEKDWSAHQANIVLDNTTVLLAFGDLLYQIAKALTGGAVTLPAGGVWTVQGSSNGLSAGMDGSNRWTSKSAFGSLNGNMAWIVLSRTKNGKTCYLRINSGYNSGHQTIITFSNVPFTGGSTTAAPTATSSVTNTIGSALGSVSAGFPYKLHFSIADDGSFNFLIGKVGLGAFCGYIGGHWLAEAHAVDQLPFAMVARFNPSTAYAPTGISLLPTDMLAMHGVAFTTVTVQAGVVTYSSGSFAEQDIGIDHVNPSAGYTDTHLYVATSGDGLIAKRSRKGRFPDIRLAPLLAAGSCEPSAAAPKSVAGPGGLLWIPMGTAPDMS